MEIDQIKERDFSREADLLRTIGHPVRLKIVVGLIGNECCVKDIWECMGLPQPLISQHLSILKDRGIVDAKRDGNRIHYSVNNPFVINFINNCLLNK